MKEHKVWLTLMPSTMFEKPFLLGLERDPNWQLVFYNNKQRMFVDITTPQGAKLFNGIFNDTTIYPNEFPRNLVKAYNMLMFATNKNDKQLGLEYAFKAFEANPSQKPLRLILSACRFFDFKPQIKNYCKKFFDDFIKNKKTYKKQNGYYHRLVAAIVVADFFRNQALKQRNDIDLKFYTAKKEDYLKEQKELVATKRW